MKSLAVVVAEVVPVPQLVLEVADGLEATWSTNVVFQVFVVWTVKASISEKNGEVPVHVATGMLAPAAVTMQPAIATVNVPEPFGCCVSARTEVGVQDAVPLKLNTTVSVRVNAADFDLIINKSPTAADAPSVQDVEAAFAVPLQTAEVTVMVGAPPPLVIGLLPKGIDCPLEATGIIEITKRNIRTYLLICNKLP